MPQSKRTNRNDANPPANQPLDFSLAAGVSAFPTDHNDQFSMNNSAYAGFGNAFTNPFHASRTNTSHHQSSTFNTNPFGMSGFNMSGPYTNAYPSYGMNAMAQNMKRSHSDNTTSHHTQHQHHQHNTHHDASFAAFSSDPSILSFSQTTANTNPYTQGTSTGQSHHNYDTLTSTSSRHKSNTTYDAFNNTNPTGSSLSSSDLFGSSRNRHHNTNTNNTISNTDLSVLSYGTTSTPSHNATDNNTSSNTNTNTNTRSKSYKHSTFTSPNLISTGHNTHSTHTHNTGGTGGGGSNNSKYNNILGPTHNSQQQNNQHIYGRHYNINNNNINSNNNLNTSGYTSKFDANGNIIYSPANTSVTYNKSSKGLTGSSSSGSTHRNKNNMNNNNTHSSSSSKSTSKLNKRSSSYTHNNTRKKKDRHNKKLMDTSGFFELNRNIHKRENAKVTGVARLSLHHNPPVTGCSISPYVILSCENGGFMQSDDKDCRYQWYKSKKRICYLSTCNKPALLQCLTCSKLSIEHASSYYCSTKCMIDCWLKHKDIHNDNNNKLKLDFNAWHDDDINKISNQWKVKNAKECKNYKENINDLYCKFPPPIINKWEKISNSNNSKIYKPGNDDVGRQLLLECVPQVKLINNKSDNKKDKSDKKEKDNKKDSKNKKDKKINETKEQSHKDEKKVKKIINECQDTSPCLPRPEPSCHRSMHYYHSDHPSDRSESISSSSSSSSVRDVSSGSNKEFTFRVLSYNCLAPIYCTRTMYPYVEPFKLEWDYRKFNIKREILRYKPDIICLQEVQRNHFENYFTTQLSLHGYEGMYRAKTRNGSRQDNKSVDGCAIFFKKNRYKVSSRYHIDFNDTSSIYLDILRNKANDTNKPMTDEQIKLMSKRLAKGNIALIVVLEEKERSGKDSKDKKNKDKDKKENKDEVEHKTNDDKDKSINISDQTMSNNLGNSGIKKQICIANTHVYWDPQFTDVKIWQAWILCEEISRALGRELPLILCGDFNSEPKSAVYEYLTKGRVETTTYDHMFKEYELSKRCILPPRDNLKHRLGLKSHYNHEGREPNYTNYTRHYKGTLDYVLYSSKSIEAIGYLQEVPEVELMKEEAFPNSLNSSDHIPLMGTFAFQRDYQQWLREKRQQRHQHSQHTSHHSSHSHTHHRSSSSHSRSAQTHHSSHTHTHRSTSHHHNNNNNNNNNNTNRSSSTHSSHRSQTQTQSQSNNNNQNNQNNNNNNTSSSTNNTIRPSAPPRHRQSHQNINIPNPTNITKSSSHSITSSQSNSNTPQHTPTAHKRHHSIEIIQQQSNPNSQSSNTNRTSSASMGQFQQSRNSRSKRRHNNNNTHVAPRNM